MKEICTKKGHGISLFDSKIEQFIRCKKKAREQTFWFFSLVLEFRFLSEVTVKIERAIKLSTIERKHRWQYKLHLQRGSIKYKFKSGLFFSNRFLCCQYMVNLEILETGVDGSEITH